MHRASDHDQETHAASHLHPRQTRDKLLITCHQLLLLLLFVSFVVIFLPLANVILRSSKIKIKKKTSRYDLQSVQSVASKLSCRRTALKCCKNTEILWYRNLKEILLPRPPRRWLADTLNTRYNQGLYRSWFIIIIIIIIIIN